MEPLPKVDPCHCHALRRAARYVTGLYDEALAPSGLRLAQFSMLVEIAGGEGIALGALAARLGLDRTTATRNLGLLVRAGLVTVGPDEADGRRKAIRLTAEGRAALRRALPLWQAAQRALEGRHGTERVEALRAALRGLEEGRKAAPAIDSGRPFA